MKASELRVDPKDLRIGNLVDYFDETEDMWYDNFEIEDLYKYDTDCYKPIPLTEEWLKKLGCDCVYQSKINKGFFYVINEEDTLEVKYVHQLQNLYFALTGEDLVVKE